MITPEQILGLNLDHLVALEQNHKLEHAAATAFLKMQQAALADSVHINICSSHRSFERQLSIWNRKWNGELPLYTLSGDTLNTSELEESEKIHAIMLWSALPGASRHHWGTDFDVYDQIEISNRNHDFKLIPDEYEGNGPCSKLASWINNYASDFGFYLPYKYYKGGVAAEPWHMSYIDSATQIEKQFNLDKLASIIESTDIGGKSEILKQLPNLVTRYTLNEGTN